MTAGSRTGSASALGDAARAMGGDPDAIGARSAPDDLLGYLEVHIEQGPVLQDDGPPGRHRDGDRGAEPRYRRFTGMAGHAGNTPMHLRRDALAGAAELVLEVERLAPSRRKA